MVALLTVKSPFTVVDPEINTDCVNGLINDAVLAKDADRADKAYEAVTAFDAQDAVPNKEPVNDPVNEPVALTVLPLTINP